MMSKLLNLAHQYILRGCIQYNSMNQKLLENSQHRRMYRRMHLQLNKSLRHKNRTEPNEPTLNISRQDKKRTVGILSLKISQHCSRRVSVIQLKETIQLDEKLMPLLTKKLSKP